MHVNAIEGPDAMAGCRIIIKQDAIKAHMIFLHDIVIAVRAHVDDGLLTRPGRELMHRFSLRAEIAARLKNQGVGIQVPWLTLDY